MLDETAEDDMVTDEEDSGQSTLEDDTCAEDDCNAGSE